MRFELVLFVLTAAAFIPVDGFAQPPAPLARGDVAASTGFIGTTHAEAPIYNRWANSGLGDISGGFYWTDHLKTEIDLLRAGEATAYGSERAGSPGSYVQLTHHYRSGVFAAGQSYQFGRNAFFHPFVTAGVSVDRERQSHERTVYLSSAGRAVLPTEIRTETRVRARPFVATGFKAYFSERGFFRTDLKLDIQSGVEQVAWKAGFGVDF
jgi:hypothetical protein